MSRPDSPLHFPLLHNYINQTLTSTRPVHTVATSAISYTISRLRILQLTSYLSHPTCHMSTVTSHQLNPTYPSKPSANPLRIRSFDIHLLCRSPVQKSTSRRFDKLRKICGAVARFLGPVTPGGRNFLSTSVSGLHRRARQTRDS